MQESKILHFLRSFPPWIVLASLTIFFVVLYKSTNDVAYKEWSSLVLASLFTALGVRATQPTNNVNNAGDLNITPSDDLKGLTPTEIDGAVESIGEGK